MSKDKRVRNCYKLAANLPECRHTHIRPDSPGLELEWLRYYNRRWLRWWWDLPWLNNKYKFRYLRRSE